MVSLLDLVQLMLAVASNGAGVSRKKMRPISAFVSDISNFSRATSAPHPQLSVTFAGTVMLQFSSSKYHPNLYRTLANCSVSWRLRLINADVDVLDGHAADVSVDRMAITISNRDRLRGGVMLLLFLLLLLLLLLVASFGFVWDTSLPVAATDVLATRHDPNTIADCWFVLCQNWVVVGFYRRVIIRHSLYLSLLSCLFHVIVCEGFDRDPSRSNSFNPLRRLMVLFYLKPRLSLHRYCGGIGRMLIRSL